MLNKTCPKRVLPIKKVDISILFFIFEIVYVPSFSLNWQLWIFQSNLSKKGNSNQKRKQIWNKFPQIYFSFTTEERSIMIEFSILELFKTLHFTLNKQFWHLGPNFPKMGMSNLKQKIWTPPLTSTYLN